MPLTIQDLDDDVAHVILSGRIDIAGAMEIDTPMSLIGGTRRRVVIDLSEVAFMASMGLRSVVMCAKAVMSKRGKVVLLSPQPAVLEVIQFSGIDELIPIHTSQAAAIAAVTEP